MNVVYPYGLHNRTVCWEQAVTASVFTMYNDHGECEDTRLCLPSKVDFGAVKWMATFHQTTNTAERIMYVQCTRHLIMSYGLSFYIYKPKDWTQFRNLWRNLATNPSSLGKYLPAQTTQANVVIGNGEVGVGVGVGINGLHSTTPTTSCYNTLPSGTLISHIPELWRDCVENGERPMHASLFVDPDANVI